MFIAWDFLLSHFLHVDSDALAQVAILTGDLSQSALDYAHCSDHVVDVNVAHVADSEHSASICCQTAGDDDAFFHQGVAELDIVNAQYLK